MLDLESLFNLNYGVYICCSKNNGSFNGCIVNTVFQITPDPPMVAVSVNKQCLTHEYINKSKVFTISILAESTPMNFIARFGFRSGRDINKLEGINIDTSQNGVPIIMDDTVGFLEAEVIETIDVETHTLFIGKITSCQTIDENKIPMTYTYYRDVMHGRTPRTAATYINKKAKERTKKGVEIMKKYKCLMCGYIYDPEKGDPANGIEAGRAFEDLPDDWTCPVCGVGKDEFEPI